MDSKWKMCRLAANESGKIRWCFGAEKAWSNKLKVLIFLPITLLLIVVIYLLVNNTGAPTLSNQKFNLENNTEITNAADQHELSYLRYHGYQDIDDIQRFTDESDEDFGVDKTILKRIPETINNNMNRIWDTNLSPEEVRRRQGANMAKYMDESVNPCDDFYQYACGKWTDYHPIPPDRGSFDTFDSVRENVYYYLGELLEENEEQTTKSKKSGYIKDILNILNRTKDKSEQYELYYPPAIRNHPYFETVLMHDENTVKIDPISKTKIMYKSCMNEEEIAKRGVQPLIALLTQLRFWPIIQDQWEEEDFDLAWLLGNLRLYNNDILIGELVAPDMNSDKYIIMIKQTTLALPRKDYYLDEDFIKYLQAYYNYIMEIVLILGADMEEALDDVKDMIKFEIELAKITPTSDCQTYLTRSDTRSSLKEFETLLPEINWRKYFSIILEEDMRYSSSNMTIITYCFAYLKNLMILIEQTTPRTLANYVLWRFVMNRIDNLDDRFNSAKQKFQNVLYGRKKLPPRKRTCVAQINAYFPFALGHLFVKHHFNEKSKNDTLIMTKAIQKSFRKILAENNWMEEKTKKLAVEKIEAMQLKIGYPDLILDRELLTVQYYDVFVNPNLYFENCLSVLQHTYRREQWKLGKVVNKRVWSTAPTVVNAYYSRHKNQIIFPAGILQPPFYHQHFPRAVNYGGIGMMIGHEVSHGFDNKGRLFDHEGRMRWWWTQNDSYNFDEISRCIIDQYSSFSLPELNINLDGLTTQAENIADNSAMKQAFKAYNEWLQENDDDDLPFVNVGGIQLFFVSFAQVWCGNARPEAIKTKLKTTVHPLGKFRVLGTLRNFPEFARVFNCEEGSPMNPVKKCSVW
ncbi:putative peptidase family M13 [Trypoxylus dichotomus]